ncbi:esterase-like activity of phytase family protein [Actinopolymorpha sp. NPDC004070]|uniref:esterase-like activity of phytase family protein n=1 Tax=Actinopolymorpha sp. NPDC004070 TaxID=3154548 RepID=UPI0033BB6959
MGRSTALVLSAALVTPLLGVALATGSAAAAPATAPDAAPNAAPPPAAAAGRHDPGLGTPRLLGVRTVPKGLVVGGLSVGELSGLDRDPRTGRWYLLSDDSEDGPVRMFTARFEVSEAGVGEIRFTGATALERTDGSTFPPFASADPEVADPESIRVDPRDDSLYWTSEGKRVVPTDGSAPALIDPWVRQATSAGKYVRQFAGPADLAMHADEVGPRANATFEGMTLTTDGRRLVTSMEGPLYQDGPSPTVDRGALTRLTWYDKRTGRAFRQVAYPLDPIPVAPNPPTASADNGVSELLAVDRHRYLVLERSFASGVGNSIRLYEIDDRGATNVLRRASLADGGYRPVRKRLVVDFADFAGAGLPHVDNLEGMAWGPRLATGERTLVFVSDDNFNPSQVTQVVALAVR